MTQTGYILAVIEIHRPDGATGGTGGTLSNEHLLGVVSERRPVRLLTLDGFPFPEEDEHHHHLRYDPRPAPGLRRLGLIRGWLPFVRREVAAAIERHGRPDAILTTTSTVCALDPKLSDAPGAAIIQAFENFGALAPGVTWSTRVDLGKQSIVRWFSDAAYIRRARVICANSEYMAGQVHRYLKVPDDRIVVVPQLCDVVPLSAPHAPPAASVGFVMRSADKNPELVSALARLAPDLRFLIYGARPEGVFPPNVEIMGWASDRNAMFSSARVWVVPSKWPEPFGRVSMEALAADRPVLVADVGGLPETVADPRYLVTGYDPETWLSQIRQLLLQPAQITRTHGELTRARFSRASHQRAVHLLLDRLLGERTNHAESNRPAS